MHVYIDDHTHIYDARACGVNRDVACKCSHTTMAIVSVSLLCVQMCHFCACRCVTFVRADVSLLCVQMCHFCACRCVTFVLADVSLLCIGIALATNGQGHIVLYGYVTHLFHVCTCMYDHVYIWVHDTLVSCMHMYV